MKYSILWLVALALVITFGLSSCISLDDTEGLIKEGTEGVAKIQLANAVEDLTHTRELKAKTAQELNRAVADTKDNQLMLANINANVELAKNNRYIGWLEGAGVWLFFIVIARVIRYVVSIYRPSEVVKKYG